MLNKFKPLYPLETYSERKLRGIKMAFKVIWSFLLVMTIGFILLFFIDLFSKSPVIYNSFSDFSVMYEINKNPGFENRETLVRSETVKHAILKPVGVLYFEMKNRQLLILRYAKTLFFFGIILAVFYQLKKFAYSLSPGNFFTKAQLQMIRKIAGIFFVSGAIIGLYTVAHVDEEINNLIFSGLVSIQNGKVSIYPAYFNETGYILSVVFSVISLLFVTFSMIFSYGVKLQEENDLTV